MHELVPSNGFVADLPGDVDEDDDNDDDDDGDEHDDELHHR